MKSKKSKPTSTKKQLSPNQKLKEIFSAIEEILTYPEKFNHTQSPRDCAINKLATAKKIVRKNNYQINTNLIWQKIKTWQKKIDAQLPKCLHPGPSAASCDKNACFSKKYQDSQPVIPNYYKL
ncbi:MAG: hypothetical protein ACOZAJ_00095 [Patescibacteria group bacterium]